MLQKHQVRMTHLDLDECLIRLRLIRIQLDEIKIMWSFAGREPFRSSPSRVLWP